jgi:uncharacterized iron-regulated protein
MKDDALGHRRKYAKPCRQTVASAVQSVPAHRSRGLPPPWARCGAFFFVALLSGCTPKSKPTTTAPTPNGGGPIAKVIYSPSRGAFIDRATLEADLFAAHYVLLGEKHDAKEHHDLQLALLRSLIGRGRKPALVLEMLEIDAQAVIDSGADLAPHAPGWDWPFYAPLVAVARQFNMPVVAGNYPRAKIKAAFHGTPISAEDRATFGLDTEFPGRASLEEELLASHCGQLPKSMLPGFVDAQRLRDGQMAERMIARATPGGAVLIAGSGHVRNDRGVPWVIRTRDKNAKVFSLAFLEGKPDTSQPLPYDAVWFTAPVTREDPCAK